MPDQPSLVTIPNVPIISTGTYQLSTGETTFTSEDLAAAVNALDDPAVRPPRLKLGHTSEFGDAEPCFGKVLNMRLSENGETVLGDYVDVPRWLAEVLATAYPSRSMEGAINAQTATGKTHRLVIEAVSLLGVILPGVSTLEDLSQMYGSEQPAGTEIVAGTPVAAATIPKGAHVQASIGVEDVRREFYASLTDEQAYWWVREIRLEPNELIVEDDDSGALYRVGFTAADSGISFTDPAEVEVVYQDKVGAAQAATHGSRQVAVYASRDESREQTEQETDMDGMKIREALGLDSEASDEEVIAAAAAATESASDETTEEQVDEVTEVEETEETEETEVEEDEAVDDGTVKVDASVWKQTVDQAKQGAAARAEQITERRESILAAAVKAGKIAPASKDSWRKKLVANQEATEAELDSLAEGLLPVSESKIEASKDASSDAYPAGLFPELSQRGSTNTVTKEVE